MKKSIFLFFAAILCAMTANAAFYYRGNDNGWGGTEMQAAANGLYYYYKDTKAGEFKITNKKDSWNGHTEYTKLHNKYNGANITLTGGNGSNCNNPTTNSYILLYQGNNGKEIIVCASTTLPTGLNEVWIKHPWGGGDWSYKQATDNGDGTFSLSAKYGESGCNLNAYNGENAQWWYDLAEIEVEAGLNKGDEAVFTVNAVTRKISVTKKVSKNLGDITITMNCTQQPKIFFWDVEGKTCADWPGETMTATGTNSYTYTFTNVDIDLGVNYKINLKEVNENEWNTGDLHTTTNVTHDVSDLNIPKIVVLGVNGDWGSTNTLTELSNDYLSVSKTISVEEVKTHDIKMHVGDNQYQGGNVVDITRANPSSEKFDQNYSYENGKFTADIAGDYVFTYTYKTHTLTVTYPELPTPEYKDITITVYAKEVPNIWWWNGGDQCPSTEDIVNPSTGNKYQWDEAPAMEKVAGEDNWYTKTFAQVDITKGGIKFKLRSADYSTSTTNEVVTTEDKCYDARVIATVTETTCGELPSGEVPTVTYNVTVPTGTPACYIAGAMNGWSHQAMTKVDETHYTITIEGAQKTQEYKYSASNNWDLVELNEDGSEKSNRTWTENDVVAKWAEPAKCYLMGIGGDWTTGIEMEEDGDQFKLLCQPIAEGEQFKFKYGDTWTTEVENYDANGVDWVETSPGSGQYNITLPAGNYDFYYKKNENKVWIGVCTPATPTPDYTRTVTEGNYGTICLPYASSSHTGMELYVVSWLQKNGETPVNLYLDQLEADAQLEAGKPYIFRATSTELTVTYTGDAAVAPIPGESGLTGSFDAIPAGGVLTGNYVIAQNKFWTATAEASAPENRAYINATLVPTTEPAKVPGRRRVSLGAAGENAETGVDNIITTDAPVKVIENGQLIIVRGGVKYNVQGQKL